MKVHHFYSRICFVHDNCFHIPWLTARPHGETMTIYNCSVCELWLVGYTIRIANFMVAGLGVP